MRRALPVAGAVAVAVLLGYGVADARDLVPGVLTTRPAVPAPAAFPQVALPESTPAPVLAARAAVPAASAAPQVDALVAALGPGTAVDVVDLADGASVGSHRADAPVAPASSLKLLTAIAALAELGPDATLTTRAAFSGGRVTLVGGGDTLLATGAPAPDDVAQASLTALAGQVADELHARGIAAVEVAVDESLFPGPRYAANWGDVDRLHVMPATPLALLTGRPDGTAADPEPGLTAGEAFAVELRAAGVAVEGAVVSAPAPAEATVIGSVASAPLWEVVAWTLKQSDNSTTEALGRLVAVARGGEGSAVGATRAVRERLGELGAPVDGLVLDDVCGLSSANRVSAAQLTAALAMSVAGTEPRLNGLPAALAVGHLDGTLADRLTAAPGVVRGKTGTLAAVASLSGIVQTDSGATLAFAAIATDVELEPARAALDEFAAGLARSG